MDSPRVGVLTEDPALVIALGLRRSGMRIEEVDAPESLATCDVALLDLPSARDLEILLGRVGPVPTVVLLSTPLPVPAGVRVVRRPCSVEQVIEALTDAHDGVEVVEEIVLDDPVLASPTAEPLFVGRTAPGVAAGWSSQPDPPPAAPRPIERLAPAPRPTPLAARLARQLREATDATRQLGAATLVSGSLAERIAEAIQAQHRADHACLWTRFGDDLVVLGVVGGGSAAHDIRLRDGHPTLEAARRGDGRFLRGPDEEPPHAPGLPGSWSMTFGVVLLDDLPGPVDAVTISGPAVTAESLQAVRDLFV